MEAREKNTQSKLGLTPRQKKLYDIIRDFITVNEYSPSYEELTQLNGSRSKAQIHA